MKLLPALMFLAFPVLLVMAPARAAVAPVLFVQNVISGDEILLNDGRMVQLEGAKAPLVSTPELRRKAAILLHEITQGHTLLLSHVESSRYSGITAQVDVVQKDGSKVWLQGEMLRAGFAFVYPPTGEEARLPEMLKQEGIARHEKNGIWANYLYADLPSRDAARRYGSYAFVTGTVKSVKQTQHMVYLDFGADWRKDFAINIAAHDLKAFRKANIDPLSYQGKRVRVRGWIARNYEPTITVTNPAQIEILGQN